jgi:hypothetical protein
MEEYKEITREEFESEFYDIGETLEETEIWAWNRLNDAQYHIASQSLLISELSSKGEVLEREKKKNELDSCQWQVRALKTMLAYIASTNFDAVTRAAKISEGESFLKHAEENAVRLESELTSLNNPQA